MSNDGHPRYTRKERTAPSKPLPPSSDTEFWGPDAVMAQYNPNTQGAATMQALHGEFSIENGYVVCGRCGGNHTIPIDLNKYDIVEGKIQKRA